MTSGLHSICLLQRQASHRRGGNGQGKTERGEGEKAGGEAAGEGGEAPAPAAREAAAGGGEADAGSDRSGREEDSHRASKTPDDTTSVGTI